MEQKRQTEKIPADAFLLRIGGDFLT